MELPSLGRIVHIRIHPNQSMTGSWQVVPAIVTEEGFDERTGEISVTAFPPGMRGVPMDKVPFLPDPDDRYGDDAPVLGWFWPARK